MIVMQNTYMAPPKNGSKLANDVAPSIKEAIYQVRARYVESFFNGSLAQQAEQVAATAGQDSGTIDSVQIARFIDQMRDKQMNDIVSAVQNAISNENVDSVKLLTEKGWIYAGSLYREMGHIKDAVRNTTVSTSEYVSGSSNPLETVLSGETLTAANAVYTRYSTVGNELAKRILQTASTTTDKQPTTPN